MTPLLILIAAGLLALYVYKFLKSIPKNYPPGPIPLPIWGTYTQCLLESYAFPYKAMHQMAKRYNTNVLGMFMGSIPTVVACDMETVREVLLKPEFQGRIDAFLPRYRANGQRLGIIFSEGDLWMEQKRYTLRNLRDFGFGRRSDILEGKLADEINDLIELLRNGDKPFCKDGLVKIPEAFYAINTNMASIVYSGECKSQEDAFNFANNMVEQSHAIEPTAGALNFTPWMRYFASGPIGFDTIKTTTNYARNFVQKLISEHKVNITDDTANDFIDVYLHELNKRMKSDGPYSTFSEAQLEVLGMDILFAGATTVPFMMGFIILLITKHQEVLKKCQKEIDDVVGRDRLPTLNDRQNLHYMEATIRESLRFQTLLPLAIPHKAVEDTTLGGYFVPKGAMVYASLYSAHKDEKVWQNPEKFSPERFISENGQLNRRDPSVPFGLGKRVCAGETFARQNIFVTISSLLQNFSFEPPENNYLPDLSENLSGVHESPKHYWVKVSPRS